MATFHEPARRERWWRRRRSATWLLLALGVVFCSAATLTVLWVARLASARGFAAWMTPEVAAVVAVAGLGSFVGLLASVMQTRRDRLLAIVLAVALIGSLWQPFSRVAVEGGMVPATFSTCPLDDFVLEDLDGGEVRLSDFRGRVVLVEVWRTWCFPCIGELPNLAYAHRTLADEGLVVLAISDEPAELQRPVRDEYGLPFPMLIDDGSLTRPIGDVLSFPSTFLIDRDGCLFGKHIRGTPGLQRLFREVRGGSEEPSPFSDLTTSKPSDDP